ncbi:MAG: alpha/beta fold hydrolase, partial [Acidobacteria bacterium]|nr:alpha/beta fold hydrolase [Acidobacteriota bacterium]
MLLLHGAGASTHTWRDVIPRLLPFCEILALDLPGQGFSSGSAPRFTLPAMAQDIATLQGVEGFEAELVVGHSAGAAIGLRMALDGGARPKAVLCLNGALTPFRGVA